MAFDDDRFEDELGIREERAASLGMDVEEDVLATPGADPADPDDPPQTSRKVRRRGRRTRMRSKTIAMKRLTKEELRIGALLYPTPVDVPRPQTRGECKEEARPCP